MKRVFFGMVGSFFVAVGCSATVTPEVPVVATVPVVAATPVVVVETTGLPECDQAIDRATRCHNETFAANRATYRNMVTTDPKGARQMCVAAIVALTAQGCN